MEKYSGTIHIYDTEDKSAPHAIRSIGGEFPNDQTALYYANIALATAAAQERHKFYEISYTLMKGPHYRTPVAYGSLKNKIDL